VVATDDVTKILGNHVIKFGLFADLNENGQEGTWTENPNPSTLEPATKTRTTATRE
jgi:hypothetical protein